MKKGTLLDLPVSLALLLSGAMTIFIVFLVLINFQSAWTFGGESKVIIDTGVEAFTVFDSMFIVFAIGLGLFSVISAFYVDAHPITFIFSMILLGIIVMVSAMITNAFDLFATNVIMESVVGEFTYIILFMRNLPLIFFILGLMIAIALHGKPRGQGGGAGF